MSPNNNTQNQTRFFTAVLLSLGVLLLWSYLFPPPKPDGNLNTNTETAQQQTVNTAPTPNNAVPQTQTGALSNTSPDDTPNRVITVKTPLYEAKFDSRGALVTSWILLQNRTEKGEKPLFNASSTKDEKHPLELISAEALKRREIPLKLSTGDASFDALLNERNYQIVGADGDEIVLNGDESRKVDFVLRDEGSQTEAVKSLTFHANGYVSDLQTKLVRGGQILPNAKLLIGANIGDQGIKHYTYYAIEPEAVAVVNNDTVERHRSPEFADKTNDKVTVKQINGAVDWAGVGDTYFAMAAIPAQPLSGLELQTVKYEVQLAEPRTNGIIDFITGKKTPTEDRHLISAYVPIQTDGVSTTKLYVGTKDHNLLSEVSPQITQQMGRTVDLDKFINYYGWLSVIVAPLAIRISWVLGWLSGMTNNYGVSILIFTVLLYMLLFPVRWYQSKSFKKAGKNAPKMKELQDRLKEMQAKKVPVDDPRMRELQMEQLKLTKDAVPIGGCLPLLLQMPILFAMLAAITISLDFRQASFLWLPDLSAGDPFHILEFAFAGSMALSMLFSPTAPAITPEQQMQQKMMTYMMPLMMLWVMWGSPSGLLFYWLTGNIIGFGQQLLINRLNKSSDDPPTATTNNSRALTKKEMKASLSPSS
ncbi:MAG: membrane protein insertase YidC [Pyrinomonadaceae bacterium]